MKVRVAWRPGASEEVMVDEIVDVNTVLEEKPYGVVAGLERVPLSRLIVDVRGSFLRTFVNWESVTIWPDQGEGE